MTLGRNAAGQVTSVTGPRPGVAESYAYDAAGNLISHTNALGHITSFSGYDADGRASGVTLPNGQNLTLGYDAQGRLIAVSSAGLVTGYAFDPVGRLKTVQLPTGLTLTYGYDTAHRLESITDHRGNKQQLTHNLANGVTQHAVLYPNGTVATQLDQTFDLLNRVSTRTGAHFTQPTSVLLRP